MKRRRSSGGPSGSAGKRRKATPTAQEGLDPARAVVAESEYQYLIDWEDDKKTGASYLPSWVPKNQATALLKKGWRKKWQPQRVPQSIVSETDDAYLVSFRAWWVDKADERITEGMIQDWNSQNSRTNGRTVSAPGPTAGPTEPSSPNDGDHSTGGESTTLTPATGATEDRPPGNTAADASNAEKAGEDKDKPTSGSKDKPANKRKGRLTRNSLAASAGNGRLTRKSVAESASNGHGNCELAGRSNDEPTSRTEAPTGQNGDDSTSHDKDEPISQSQSGDGCTNENTGASSGNDELAGKSNDEPNSRAEEPTGQTGDGPTSHDDKDEGTNEKTNEIASNGNGNNESIGESNNEPAGLTEEPAGESNTEPAGGSNNEPTGPTKEPTGESGDEPSSADNDGCTNDNTDASANNDNNELDKSNDEPATQSGDEPSSHNKGDESASKIGEKTFHQRSRAWWVFD